MTADAEAGDKLARLQRLFAFVDLQVLPNLMGRATGFPMDVIVYPPWVMECGRKVVGAQFPQLFTLAEDSGKSPAYRIGFCAGQMDAGQRLLGRLFAPLFPKELPALTERQDRELKEFLYGGNAADFKEPNRDLIPEEMKTELAAFDASLSLEESVDRSRGFADAQAMTAGENHSTETTRVYLAMLLFWRVIEGMNRLEQLEELLVKLLGRNAVGSDLKRLRQLCGRIGKRFQPPGRPQKLPQRSKSVR